MAQSPVTTHEVFEPATVVFAIIGMLSFALSAALALKIASVVVAGLAIVGSLEKLW